MQKTQESAPALRRLRHRGPTNQPAVDLWESGLGNSGLDIKAGLGPGLSFPALGTLLVLVYAPIQILSLTIHPPPQSTWGSDAMCLLHSLEVLCPPGFYV